MAAISQVLVQGHLAAATAAGATTATIGKALEDAVAYLFETVPGIEVTRRNVMNPFDTEEIDVAFFNGKRPKGLYFLPDILLVECKNWSSAVGSSEVSWFISKLRNRGLPFGILIAANGVTGNNQELHRAHNEIASALKEGIRTVVITRAEIDVLTHSDELVRLVKEKLCDLAVMGRIA